LFRFRSRLVYSEKEIRKMSPETRERMYRQEKDELFMQIRGMPAEEVAAAHEALVRKRRI